jgi:hypothetical protein
MYTWYVGNRTLPSDIHPYHFVSLLLVRLAASSSGLDNNGTKMKSAFKVLQLIICSSAIASWHVDVDASLLQHPHPTD